MSQQTYTFTGKLMNIREIDISIARGHLIYWPTIKLMNNDWWLWAMLMHRSEVCYFPPKTLCVYCVATLQPTRHLLHIRDVTRLLAGNDRMPYDCIYSSFRYRKGCFTNWQYRTTKHPSQVMFSQLQQTYAVSPSHDPWKHVILVFFFIYPVTQTYDIQTQWMIFAHSDAVAVANSYMVITCTLMD